VMSAVEDVVHSVIVRSGGQNGDDKDDDDDNSESSDGDDVDDAESSDDGVESNRSSSAHEMTPVSSDDDVCTARMSLPVPGYWFFLPQFIRD
jgi:nitric oxide reductase activation protein